MQPQVTGVPRPPSLRPGNSRRPRSASAPRASTPARSPGICTPPPPPPQAHWRWQRTSKKPSACSPQVCTSKIQAPSSCVILILILIRFPEHNRNGGAWRAFRAASRPSEAPLFLFFRCRAKGMARFGLRGARQTRVREARAGARNRQEGSAGSAVGVTAYRPISTVCQFKF